MTAFFGGAGFYGIPGNAVPKNDDPFGRIVHDYGYYPKGSYSVNSAHSCTSVRYLTTKEVVSIVDDVTWYIKGDLKDGFRHTVWIGGFKCTVMGQMNITSTSPVPLGRQIAL